MAAAVSVQSGVLPADLSGQPERIQEIRQRLLRQDLFLIGERDKHEDNLVAQARITASSEQSNGSAQNILSGQNRCVIHEHGIPAERGVAGSHRWMSEPAELPAWIEFRWQQPQSVHSLDLVFDSGLHRRLTLSMSSQITSRMIWGTGQPELVKAFRVEYLNAEGNWQPLADVPLYWQRRWQHKLEQRVQTQAVRLTILETWGSDHARLVSACIM